jgi:hypothetical protein
MGVKKFDCLQLKNLIVLSKRKVKKVKTIIENTKKI